jgi:hypothetical protein
MDTLKGKTAVVTGSTSGIGLSIARAFARAGANVVINGFGPSSDIESERAGIESDFKVKAVHSPGRDDRAGRKDLRLGRRPRQQCGHPRWPRLMPSRSLNSRGLRFCWAPVFPGFCATSKRGN